MGDEIRAKAISYLLQVGPIEEVKSIGASGPKFTKLTGITQAMLQANWSGGGIMTSCNSFVATYAASIGLVIGGKSLGQFNLDKKVASWGKAYAWIPASSGARPKDGDIFELNRLHQGVTFTVAGTSWNTVEGGQGGKSSGFDMVKRKENPQGGGVLTHQTYQKTIESVKGWLDIDLYLNGLPTTLPIPPWLPGWWQVPWQGQIFYYFFEMPGTVKWTLQKPVSDAFGPYNYNDKGTAVFNSQQVLTLVWSATGTIEKFKRQIDKVMIGDWNSTEPLMATRCF